VRLVRCRDVAVTGNRLRGAVAVHVLAGRDVTVEANGVEWAEVAVLDEAATGTVVQRNHLADVAVEHRASDHPPI
jgi:hypothetical protein